MCHTRARTLAAFSGHGGDAVETNTEKRTKTGDRTSFINAGDTFPAKARETCRKVQ